MYYLVYIKNLEAAFYFLFHRRWEKCKDYRIERNTLVSKIYWRPAECRRLPCWAIVPSGKVMTNCGRTVPNLINLLFLFYRGGCWPSRLIPDPPNGVRFVHRKLRHLIPSNADKHPLPTNFISNFTISISLESCRLNKPCVPCTLRRRLRLQNFN